MVRWMCSGSPEDRFSPVEVRTRLKLKSLMEYLQDKTLQCFGHLERMEVLSLVNVEPSRLVVVSPEDDLLKLGI